MGGEQGHYTSRAVPGAGELARIGERQRPTAAFGRHSLLDFWRESGGILPIVQIRDMACRYVSTCCGTRAYTCRYTGQQPGAIRAGGIAPNGRIFRS